MRTVPVERLQDESQWGPELELALEAEFWDLITNSDHAAYPAWDRKVADYQTANEAASARLELLRTAGAVFRVSPAFDPERDRPNFSLVLSNISQIIDGANEVSTALPYHVPAQVFYHNNTAMRGLMLGPLEEGLYHLEQLLTIPGSEGRAAAPFTYGMLNDDAALQYAIDLNENCETFVCMWASKIAPYKPIGQLMMLAELHAIAGDMDAMNSALDRADALAVERNWPFRDRITALRAELPARAGTYVSGESRALGAFRWPMPVYSNEVNCSNCHVGAQPGTSGETVDPPYEGHYVTTPAPEAADLSHLTMMPTTP